MHGDGMAEELIATTGTVLDTGNGVWNVPSLVISAGGDAQQRFIKFFAAQIRQRNTREAYVRAVRRPYSPALVCSLPS